MQFSFLLGSAGTGKTFRCLQEIRNELLDHPEGPPLIFLAPKQSTFQLERQLLETGGLSGYSRLHILSFERLARFIFATLRRPVPSSLSEQGRTMVLRAILGELAPHLTIFRNASRHPGFAEELSGQIREFQNHRMGPVAVRKLAVRLQNRGRLAEKLLDLAAVYEKYLDWLRSRSLDDGDSLLTRASELLQPESPFQVTGLWFDGFAQLTPQELELLSATLRFTEKATLAFCLDEQDSQDSPISPWFLVRQTYHRCRAAIENIPGNKSLKVVNPGRDAKTNRFAASQALLHLEKHWGDPKPFTGRNDSVRIVQAADAEAEIVFAAREILKHVGAGGRFRETAILLRNLQNDYPHLIRRVFHRYSIPFFLDHRESVAHHPIAELTRGALRTVAFKWKHQDWFATLKCGLVQLIPKELDRLENEALARGWDASNWREGFTIARDRSLEIHLNRQREQLIAPFVAFEQSIGSCPAADTLAAAIRKLWQTLSVEEQLQTWTKQGASGAVHNTVWDQMNGWLDDLILAFSGQHRPVAEWLPILEAGLRGLSIGVVPPVLDQVLIGSVDRSRNPDLKLVFVLGMNERVFPAVPARDTLLGEDDRMALLNLGSTLSESSESRASAEQFYGYIAMTRARERLCLTFARFGADGKPINASRFISHVRRLFPALEIESFKAPSSTADLLHPCEFAALGIPRIGADQMTSLQAPDPEESLDPANASRLYGPELEIAVSSLERFASCPFQFFIRHGLRVHEREEFQLDVREQGSFQHEVLALFHEELASEGRKWRDLDPAEARDRVGRIADHLTATFKNGLLAATEQNRYTAETYKKSLQEFIAVLIAWFKTNKFDPHKVEFAFGKESNLPGWRLPLAHGRALILHGRLDRIDLLRTSETDACCVIIDYKSGLREPDRTLLYHGVQQQLPGYLLAMTRVEKIAEEFGVSKLVPAGCFILPLNSRYDRGKTRRDALADAESARRSAYTHGGIFDINYLRELDSTAPDKNSGQFKFRINKGGTPHASSFNALSSENFRAVLDRTEELMREFADRIYSGDISIHPFKKGREVACDKCHFQPICRFDPWTQTFRSLHPPARPSREKLSRSE